MHRRGMTVYMGGVICTVLKSSHGCRYRDRGKEKSMVHLGPCYRKNLCVDCDSEICGHAGVPEADCPLWVCRRPELECKDCDILKEYVEAYRKGGPDEH